MPPLVLESLDDLKAFVGRELAVTDWFSVTQDRIQQFAEATEDRQWIHLDKERAKLESPYATTIAHGFLTLSLLSHLARQAIADSKWCGDGGKLRAESGAISCSCSC